MMRPALIILLSLVLPFVLPFAPSPFWETSVFAQSSGSSSAVRPKPLLTSWGAQLAADTGNVHAEYPRPTLVRSDWLNLNGHWDWKDNHQSGSFSRRILVPFPPESTLSGIAQHTERCTYRRTFTIPRDWSGSDHIILHFGAVDWEATVFINGQQVGTHQGGYTSFSFDITPYIRRNEPNEIVVQVFDPSQRGEQPRGKQSDAPSGIWYTASSGIWQTVWLEPVPASHIQSLRIRADLDTGQVTIFPVINTAQKNLSVVVEAFDGETMIAKSYGGTDGALMIRFDKEEHDIKVWSPDSPHLYQLCVRLMDKEQLVDQVGSYFAFRKIEVVKRSDGHPVIHLNGKRLFLMGIVDQGFWPDGLYTTPSDRAQLMDIRVAKSLGFNVIRKYQKIEPERWYFWCDRLGILVWQDMPSGDNRAPSSQEQFRVELQRMIQARSHHLSIIAWTIFNEGAGQHKVPEYVDLVRRLDPTRLINAASGWTDSRVGDVNVAHRFPGPEMPESDPNRASIIGLFGGLTLIPPAEHRWSDDTWAFQHVSDSDNFVRRYQQMHEELRRLIQTQGLAGAFFHQLTDIEAECNGVITYDRHREGLKVPPETLEQINSETIRQGSE